MYFKKYILIFVSILSLFVIGCNKPNDDLDNQEKPIEEKDDDIIKEIQFWITGVKENLIVGETCEITLNGIEKSFLEYEITGDAISFNNMIIKAEKAGTAKIIFFTKNSSTKIEYNFIVENEPIELVKSISFTEGYVELEYGDIYQIDYVVTPNNLNPLVNITYSKEGIVEIDENNLLKAIGVGEVILTIKALDGSDAISQMSVIVEDTIAPVVTFLADEYIKLPIGTSNYNFISDIKIIDNVDGDITNNVRIDKNGLKIDVYGLYTITYSVKDSSGNAIKFIRNVEVYWPYETTFIGHGGSYFGVMNTMDAIKYAVEVLHYPMIEVDLCQTSDGVFVLCHDAKFGDYTISKTPWSTFESYYVTKSRSGGLPSSLGLIKNSTYTTRLCKLEEALDYCKEHNTILLIELKESSGINGSTTSGMARLMEVIKTHDMLDLTAFTCFPYMVDNLKWLRNNGYNNIIQYLCGTCEKLDTFDLCLEYNFICAINPIYGDYSNSDEWIQKYLDAGIKLSAYTFDQYTDYATVQTWIDKGISYITSDWHDPKELDLELIK